MKKIYVISIITMLMYSLSILASQAPDNQLQVQNHIAAYNRSIHHLIQQKRVLDDVVDQPILVTYRAKYRQFSKDDEIEVVIQHGSQIIPITSTSTDAMKLLSSLDPEEALQQAKQLIQKLSNIKHKSSSAVQFLKVEQLADKQKNNAAQQIITIFLTQLAQELKEPDSITYHAICHRLDKRKK